VTRAIADTDILSAFGKVEKVEILGSLFDEILIANSVFFMDLEEILRALKVKGILNRGGLKQLMEAIEREDRTIIKAKDRILRE